LPDVIMTHRLSAGMASRLPRLGSALALAALCLALPACGGGHNPVSGKVLYQGKPAEGALVIFHPKEGDTKPTAPRPTGVAGSDGTFTLESIRTPGAPAGEYLVTITWPASVAAKGKGGLAPGDDEKAAPTDRLGGRYADRTKSKIEVTIKSGRNSLEPFNLE
jgi:hypothetical protein